ncbi:MAG: carboxypeptidase-like regulatory domain-containing protein [Microscillaceae bacterium]|nr:carboxypeptidase-like regulatory domain-containing protein [Microscillaceae bacterium]MDW8460944.1 carboxypeptidase-like regulatory domain-containing protein [Cytophagales bacterium]
MNFYKLLSLCCVLGVLLLFQYKSFAQGEKNVIYFSGIVVDGIKTEPLAGVGIYIPKAGRGTVTDENGYFTLPVMVGDSVVISSVGYKKRYYKIPKMSKDAYSVVIELTEDNTLLPVVEVFPYPTEEIFKEAFLSVRLPDEEKIKALRKNLNEKVMFLLAASIPMDGTMNFRNLTQQQFLYTHNRYAVPMLQLLNPLAWAELFRSIKRGDLKKEKWKTED